MHRTLALLCGALAVPLGAADLRAQDAPATPPTLVWPVGSTKSYGSAAPASTLPAAEVTTAPPNTHACAAKGVQPAPAVKGTRLGFLAAPAPTPPPAYTVTVSPLAPVLLTGGAKDATPAAQLPSTPVTSAILTAPATPVPIPVADPADPGPASGFYGGASLYLVRPYMQNNTAYRTVTRPGTPTSNVVDTQYSWNYAPAADFWLGWTSPSGLGIRARYFGYNQASATSSLTNTAAPPASTQIGLPLANFPPLSTGGFAPGSPGTLLGAGVGFDQLAFRSDLQIQAVDLDATYVWQRPGWLLLASAGTRFQILDQGYHMGLLNTGAGVGATEVQAFNYNRNFQGAGPVVGLFGKLRLGQSNFSLFGNVRGALLVGTTNELVTLTQAVRDNVGLGPGGVPLTSQLLPGASRTTDHVLSVAELALGVQYDLALSASDLFFRAGMVNQTYFDAGNASLPTGNLSLFGVQLSAGVRY